MMKPVFAAALVTLSFASVANATPGREPSPAPAEAAARPATTRYCVDPVTETGTLFHNRICRTRDQWLARGFDPLNPVK